MNPSMDELATRAEELGLKPADLRLAPNRRESGSR